MVQAERLRVVDDEMNDVPADGQTMGEIVMRGNNVMKRYFEDDEATTEAFRGGWSHSCDLGVMQSGGYVRLMDRAKDVVVSVGRTSPQSRSSRPWCPTMRWAEAAVTGVPDEKSGERAEGLRGARTRSTGQRGGDHRPRPFEDAHCHLALHPEWEPGRCDQARAGWIACDQFATPDDPRERRQHIVFRRGVRRSRYQSDTPTRWSLGVY
jgi:hypothetical protein